MNTETEHDEWRPFHETIVEMLSRIGGFGGETRCFLELIRITKIPAGHDEIIAAIEKREKEGIGVFSPYCVLQEVKSGLREQKRLAEKEAARKKQVEEAMDDLMKQLENWKIRLSG